MLPGCYTFRFFGLLDFLPVGAFHSVLGYKLQKMKTEQLVGHSFVCVIKTSQLCFIIEVGTGYLCNWPYDAQVGYVRQCLRLLRHEVRHRNSRVTQQEETEAPAPAAAATEAVLLLLHCCCSFALFRVVLKLRTLLSAVVVVLRAQLWVVSCPPVDVERASYAALICTSVFHVACCTFLV